MRPPVHFHAWIPKGGWLFPAITAGVIALIGAMSLAKGDRSGAAGMVAFLLLFALFIWPLRLEIDDEEIRYRSGVAISRRMKLVEIDRVGPGFGFGTISPRRYPGTKVTGRGPMIFICLHNEEDLLRELEARAPHLHRYGAELRRSPDAESPRHAVRAAGAG